MEHGMAKTKAGALTPPAGKAARKPAAAKAAAAVKKPVVKTAAAKPAASKPAAAKAAARKPAVTKPVVAKPPANKRAATPAAKVARSAARAVAKAPPQAGARTRASRAAVAERPDTPPARPQLVRDSFTMPEQEYAVLGAVKQACLKAGFEVKKSELLRVGVALLGQLDLASLRAVLGALPQLKTGRPPV
jgi:hypothetical protein